MATQSLPDLLSAIRHVFHLFNCVLELAVFGALIVVPAVLLGRERWKRRVL